MTPKDALSMFVEQAFRIAQEKGWHDTEVTLGERIALMHSELSEALEEFRNGHPIDEVRYEDGKPEGVPVELADCVIRIFDFAGAHGIDLASVIIEKMSYNQSRPHRHGGKIL